MTNYASYVDSQVTANTFIARATERVANYVNNGRSELGIRTIGGRSESMLVSDGHNGHDCTHSVEFATLIKPNAEGTVPVTLRRIVNAQPIFIHVPLDVLEGKKLR